MKPHDHDLPKSSVGTSGAPGDRAEPLRLLADREVPDGVLDGLYVAIHDRLPSVPPGGGLSLSFLEAPRSLRLWRTTALAASALAASVLLALGAGFGPSLLGGGGIGGATRATPVPIVDARGQLLEDLDVAAPADTLLRSGFQSVTWPPHRPGRVFWQRGAVNAVPRPGRGVPQSGARPPHGGEPGVGDPAARDPDAPGAKAPAPPAGSSSTTFD
jgi:hypothetical protein